jgi:predicted RNase H-like HicB family nuclease
MTHAVRFTIVLCPEADGGYSVVCPTVPGCVSQGDTLDDALDNIREAILLCLEVLRHGDRPPPVETPQLIDEEVRACLEDRTEEGLPPTVDTCVLDVDAEVAL